MKNTPQSPTPTPSDIAMENIAMLDCLVREGFCECEIDRVEHALKTNAALQAENAEQREALQSIKARVCGEMTNGWKDQWDTTNSRGAIADICDKAIAKAEQALTRPPEVK
jgi:hypothetical protein